MSTSAKEVQLALARAVASRKVPNDVVASVAKKLAQSKREIKGIDICVYGICIDYVFDDQKKLWENLPAVTEIPESRVRGIRVFPWGIPAPDFFHVRVEHEFDELNAFIPEQVSLTR